MKRILILASNPRGTEAVSDRITHLRKALSVDEVSRGLKRKLCPGSLPDQGITAVKLKTLLQDLYAELMISLVCGSIWHEMRILIPDQIIKKPPYF